MNHHFLVIEHYILCRLHAFHFFKADHIKCRFDEIVESGDGLGEWTNIFYADWGTYANDVLFPVVPMKFGDMTIPVPHDADAFLKTLYDDYMTVPPEEDRFTKPPLILDFGDGVNVIERAGA